MDLFNILVRSSQLNRWRISCVCEFNFNVIYTVVLEVDLIDDVPTLGDEKVRPVDCMYHYFLVSAHSDCWLIISSIK